MISIIICSRNPDISTSLKENIKETIGIDYEIIVIDNSTCNYSIFSAYNKGFSLSKYPNLCFLHEDVLFKTNNWGVNLINHLSNPLTGIIGVAGGKIITRIPANWWSVGYGYKNLIQHYNKRKISETESSQNFTETFKPVILLDGVILAFRNELYSKIKFDESFAGFHGYDQDISIQSTIAGFTNYVVFDIVLEHFSEGNMNAEYYRNLVKIYQKWHNYLPIFSSDITDDIKTNINKVEIKLLGKIIRRMAQVGFDSQEVISYAKYFTNILNSKAARKELNFIRIKIVFEKLFHSK